MSFKFFKSGSYTQGPTCSKCGQPMRMEIFEDPCSRQVKTTIGCNPCGTRAQNSMCEEEIYANRLHENELFNEIVTELCKRLDYNNDEVRLKEELDEIDLDLDEIDSLSLISGASF